MKKIVFYSIHLNVDKSPSKYSYITIIENTNKKEIFMKKELIYMLLWYNSC